MNLNTNMCRLDQVIRGGIGLMAVYFGFVDSSYIGEALVAIPLGVFGVLNLFSAFTKHCPVYKLVGISTCATEVK